MKEIALLPDVELARADLCMYGMEVKSSDGSSLPAKKPTGFMTNSKKIAKRLSKACDNSHRH